MYSRLLYLYQQNKLNEEELSVAVSKTWITNEQKNEIINSTTK